MNTLCIIVNYVYKKLQKIAEVAVGKKWSLEFVQISSSLMILKLCLIVCETYCMFLLSKVASFVETSQTF